MAYQLQISPVGSKTYYWEPLPKQCEFIEIPDTVKEAFFGGAAGPGKSDILILLPILRGWIKHPQFKGIIFRITNKQLEQSLIPRSKEYYYHFGGKFNEQLNKWTFPSGAWIILSFLETDADAKEHDTSQYNYIAFDELTHFNKFPYIFMLSRCRSDSPDLPAVVRSASNPGNIGHLWVRERFVEPAPLGGKLIVDPVTSLKRIFIKATVWDNPHLLKINPDYVNQLLALKEVSPAEYRAKALGDWWVFAGQVFSNFRIDHVQGEPENAIHVIRPSSDGSYFEIPKFWPRIAALDWGGSNPDTAAMTWLGICALSPTGRYYLYKELVWKGQPVSTWGTETGMICRDEGVNLLTVDPSMRQKRGEEETLFDQFIKYSELDNVDFADNDRIGGKELLQESIRFNPRPPKYIPPEGYSQDTYFYILRNHGEAAANNYYNLFLPEKPEENLPKLQIFWRCQAVIKAISACVYNTDTGNVEDVKEFQGDDPYDGIRYLLKRIDRYLREAVSESEKLARLGQITERLAKTGDQTTYYRQMEKFESDQEPERPVRTYHTINPFARRGQSWGERDDKDDDFGSDWKKTGWPFTDSH